MMAKREGGCHHEWQEKKIEYPSVNDRECIEYYKFCSKCGEEKYHYFCEFNHYERSVKKFKIKPDHWGDPEVTLMEPPVGEGGKPYCELCLAFKGYQSSEEGNAIREGLGRDYQCGFCEERRKLVAEWREKLRGKTKTLEKKMTPDYLKEEKKSQTNPLGDVLPF